MLISKVKLYSNEIEKLKEFYVTLLGFNLIDESQSSFTIQIGESEMEFCDNPLDSKPFYHFAFNIPSNQFKEAKNWIKSKVTLNIDEGNDEVYFEFINAYSLYFLDPSGNIVEFISRTSSPIAKAVFLASSIINISEINITTNHVLSVGNQINEFGIPVRDTGTLNDQFNFLGSDGSFLLLGAEKRTWYFSDKGAEIHPNTIEIDKNKVIELHKDGNISLNTY